MAANLKNLISIACQRLENKSMGLLSHQTYGDYLDLNGQLKSSLMREKGFGLILLEESQTLTSNQVSRRLHKVVSDYHQSNWLSRVWQRLTSPMGFYLDLHELITLRRMKEGLERDQYDVVVEQYQCSQIAENIGFWDKLTGSWRMELKKEFNGIIAKQFHRVTKECQQLVNEIFSSWSNKEEVAVVERNIRERLEAIRLAILQSIHPVSRRFNREEHSWVKTLLDRIRSWETFLMKTLSELFKPTADRTGSVRRSSDVKTVTRFLKERMQGEVSQLKGSLEFWMKGRKELSPVEMEEGIKDLEQGRYSLKRALVEGWMTDYCQQISTAEELQGGAAERLSEFCRDTEALFAPYEELHRRCIEEMSEKVLNYKLEMSLKGYYHHCVQLVKQCQSEDLKRAEFIIRLQANIHQRVIQVITRSHEFRLLGTRQRKMFLTKLREVNNELEEKYLDIGWFMYGALHKTPKPFKLFGFIPLGNKDPELNLPSHYVKQVKDFFKSLRGRRIEDAEKELAEADKILNEKMRKASSDDRESMEEVSRWMDRTTVLENEVRELRAQTEILLASKTPEAEEEKKRVIEQRENQWLWDMSVNHEDDAGLLHEYYRFIEREKKAYIEQECRALVVVAPMVLSEDPMYWNLMTIGDLNGIPQALEMMKEILMDQGRLVNDRTVEQFQRWLDLQVEYLEGVRYGIIASANCDEDVYRSIMRDVDRVYRHLCKRSHPDKNRSGVISVSMTEIERVRNGRFKRAIESIHADMKFYMELALDSETLEMMHHDPMEVLENNKPCWYRGTERPYRKVQLERNWERFREKIKQRFEADKREVEERMKRLDQRMKEFEEEKAKLLSEIVEAEEITKKAKKEAAEVKAEVAEAKKEIAEAVKRTQKAEEITKKAKKEAAEAKAEVEESVRKIQEVDKRTAEVEKRIAMFEEAVTMIKEIRAVGYLRSNQDQQSGTKEIQEEAQDRPSLDLPFANERSALAEAIATEAKAEVVAANERVEKQISAAKAESAEAKEKASVAETKITKLKSDLGDLSDIQDMLKEFRKRKAAEREEHSKPEKSQEQKETQEEDRQGEDRQRSDIATYERLTLMPSPRGTSSTIDREVSPNLEAFRK